MEINSTDYMRLMELVDTVQHLEEQHQHDQEKLRHFDYLAQAVPLAYEEGFHGCLNGISRSNNPYENGSGVHESLEGMAWDAGWMLRSQREYNRGERDRHREQMDKLLELLAFLMFYFQQSSGTFSNTPSS